MSDAAFKDGAEQALRLRAESPDDLSVVSALVQDALGQTSRIAWAPRHRRFTLLLNRFRWEDAPNAKRLKRPYERVQSLLVVNSVVKARGSGIDSSDADLVFSLLSIGFETGDDGTGTVRLILAGDGEIALDVECLDVTLNDVTRPYLATAKSTPSHPDT
jgi:hypothetical protein